MTYEEFKKLTPMEQEKVRTALNAMYLKLTQTSKLIPKVEFFSPTMAKSLLANPHNLSRPISDDRVRRVMDTILAGAWMANGESISITAISSLLNGNHRATAVSQLGIGIPMTIIRNVDPATFMSFDEVFVRTTPHTMHIMNIPYPKITAPATNFLIRYKTKKRLRHTGHQTTKSEQIHTITVTDPKLMDSIIRCNTKDVMKVLPPSLASFIHYLLSGIDAKMCEEFFQRLIVGDNLAANSPIKVLRDKLLEMSSTRTQTLAHDKAVYVIKAWNAWRGKKRLSKSAFKKELDLIPTPV